MGGVMIGLEIFRVILSHGSVVSIDGRVLF